VGDFRLRELVLDGVRLAVVAVHFEGGAEGTQGHIELALALALR
jgi:hypothetical protein